MFGDQAPHLVNGRRNRTHGGLGQARTGLLGVTCLDSHDKRGLREHTQPERHHQSSRGRCEVCVGQLITALAGAETGHVEHVRSLHDDRTSRPANVDGIDDQQHVDISYEQLLHQAHASDPHFQDPGACWQRLGRESLRDDDAYTVVGA